MKPSYKLEMLRVIGYNKNLIDYRTDWILERDCIELINEFGIVTNTPFSLFKNYIAQLMEYDKR